MGFLTNKKALIVGLASDRSIAYGIAQAFKREGAELAFTYQNEKLEARVAKMAKEFGSDLIVECDVAEDSHIEGLAKFVEDKWGKFDILVHSVAFAPANQIQGDYIENVDREGFNIAHNISSYSFSALAKSLYPCMNENSSMLTLSYYGAEKVISNYNVMGVAKASLEASTRYLANSLGPKKIRVNAISAGPIRTLAASGIKGLRDMLNFNKSVSPLRQNVTTEQVGNAAAFMCSDLASGITGEILHVDSGFNTIGMVMPESE